MTWKPTRAAAVSSGRLMPAEPWVLVCFALILLASFVMGTVADFGTVVLVLALGRDPGRFRRVVAWTLVAAALPLMLSAGRTLWSA